VVVGLALLGSPVAHAQPEVIHSAPRCTKTPEPRCALRSVALSFGNDLRDCGVRWEPGDWNYPLDEQALACTLGALEKHEPFLFHDASFGKDSSGAELVVGLASGEVIVTYFDSNPSGLPCFSERVVQYRCDEMDIATSAGATDDRFGDMPVPKGTKYPRCKRLAAPRELCDQGLPLDTRTNPG
jgi:hypothetical protein